MIISHRKRFIFIHTYKVAGTSVKSALRPYADIMHKKYTLRRLFYVLGLTGPVGEHATALQLRAQLPKEIFDSYFKFAFVRNPWDWQVSLYHYILSHRLHPQHRIIKSLGSFSSYLKWRTDQGVELQKDFVTDQNGNLVVDFIGKYENLYEDFSEICKTIDIDVHLPHKNPSKHHDYRNYYTDETEELVRKYYREDIEFFNYSFPKNDGDEIDKVI